MSWRKLAFGSEHPTTGNYVFSGIAYAWMALIAYGIWIDFVPADWIKRAALYVATIPAIVLSTWICLGILNGRNPRFKGSKLKLLWMGPLFVAMLTAMFWLALARGLPGMATRMSGKPVQLTAVTMHTVHHSSRYSCDYQLRGELLDETFINYFCISNTYYKAHPDHRVEVKLTGYQNALGMYVDGIYHQRDLGPYRS